VQIALSIVELRQKIVGDDSYDLHSITMPEFTQPNLHVALVHFPIGLFVTGVLVETWCMLLARKSTLRQAGRWMILLGTILSVPVVMSGLYAMQDVMKTGELIGAPWQQTLDESPIAKNPAAWEAMTDHLWLSVGATAAALLAVCVYIAMSDAWRSRMGWLVHIVLLLACVTMGVAAHHGGELVHVHAVTTTQPIDSVAPTTSPTAFDTFASLFPPMQGHVIFAGLTVAVACVALAVSVRVQSVVIEEGVPKPPFARYVWLGVLLVLITTLTGWWYLANASDQWSMEKLFALLEKEREVAGTFFTRRTIHLVGGSVLFFSTIILGLLSWLKPRSSVALTLVGLVVFASLAAQVWVGTVLLLDGTQGPVTTFAE
jgi:uncharacterized membrane protein